VRAYFINAKAILQSVFRFFDVNACWTDASFTCLCLQKVRWLRVCTIAHLHCQVHM
jgi:hypothetical protein